MLPTNLTANEVKNASGTETEMLGWRSEGRQKEYALSGEAPNAENHLLVSHQEVGSGVDARRRSANIVTLEVTGVSGVKRVIKGSIILDIPLDIADYTGAAKVLAQVGSFTFLDGTGTTFLFAGTGTGAAAILAGSL